ncbi:hypothetical protein C8J56DRAFT_1042666 [Mycena floridula]|nr:hypothetical protein C8J56DRAFT_1042666 [Mycena floridula]
MPDASPVLIITPILGPSPIIQGRLTAKDVDTSSASQFQFHLLANSTFFIDIILEGSDNPSCSQDCHNQRRLILFQYSDLQSRFSIQFFVQLLHQRAETSRSKAVDTKSNTRSK